MIEDGIILIDKPPNMSSFGVVARVRRQLSQHYGRKMKVGHTGTLDPFATGLMILVVGKECKNANEYSKLDKTYQATIVLGRTSTTGDPEGEIEKVLDKKVAQAEIEKVIEQFRGTITQTPPAYSAIKINGQRAYKLAREGKPVDMPERRVTIHSLEITNYEYPYLQIKTHVSSGTYIRTLAQDIGEKLGTGAFCSELKRTIIGKYDLKDADKTSFEIS